MGSIGAYFNIEAYVRNTENVIEMIYDGVSKDTVAKTMIAVGGLTALYAFQPESLILRVTTLVVGAGIGYAITDGAYALSRKISLIARGTILHKGD